MSKQKTPQNDCQATEPRLKLTVLITPADSGRTGRYQARLDGDGRVLCVSRTPFFDAARKLVEVGYDPDTTLVLRHEGSGTDSLQARLGTAASLTVEETPFGPRLRRSESFSAGGDGATHRPKQIGAISWIR